MVWTGLDGALGFGEIHDALFSTGLERAIIPLTTR
jgi:hypothetical protein